MGREVDCKVRYGKATAVGRALLETDEVIFRSETLRLKIPLKKVERAAAIGDELAIAWGDERATFVLGKDAERWAHAIANPKGRIDKLGVKAKMRVAIVGVEDDAWNAEVLARTDDVHEKLAKDCDIVFLGVATKRHLSRLAACKRAIRDNGAVWVVRPRGSTAVGEGEVRAAAKDAGLVDVKVARFSETHTADKFVVPVAARAK